MSIKPEANADAFRAVMQQHGAAVTIVTALLDGRFHGVTATAFCSVFIQRRNRTPAPLR